MFRGNDVVVLGVDSSLCCVRVEGEGWFGGYGGDMEFWVGCWGFLSFVCGFLLLEGILVLWKVEVLILCYLERFLKKLLFFCFLVL